MPDSVPDTQPSACHLWVIRHGEANSPTGTQSDADRTLTGFGQAQAEYLADRISGSSKPPGTVLVSPATRDQQTASPIARALNQSPVTEPVLMTDALVSDVIDLIVGRSTQHAAEQGSCTGCIVGHNPTLEDLVAVLVEGVAARPNPMRTGQAVLIRFDPHAVVGSGELLERHRLETPPA